MDDHSLSILWGTLIASVVQLFIALTSVARQWVVDRKRANELRQIERAALQAKVAAKSAHDVSLGNAVAIEEIRARVVNGGDPSQ